MPADPPGRLILTRESRDGRYAELVERHLETLNLHARDRTLTGEELVEWDRLSEELARVDPARARDVCAGRVQMLDRLAAGRTFTTVERREWDRLTAQAERLGGSMRLQAPVSRPRL